MSTSGQKAAPVQWESPTAALTPQRLSQISHTVLHRTPTEQLGNKGVSSWGISSNLSQWRGPCGPWTHAAFSRLKNVFSHKPQLSHTHIFSLSPSSPLFIPPPKIIELQRFQSEGIIGNLVGNFGKFEHFEKQWYFLIRRVEVLFSTNGRDKRLFWSFLVTHCWLLAHVV